MACVVEKRPNSDTIWVLLQCQIVLLPTHTQPKYHRTNRQRCKTVAPWEQEVGSSRGQQCACVSDGTLHSEHVGYQPGQHSTNDIRHSHDRNQHGGLRHRESF